MWHGILGHDKVVEQFRRTLAAGRLASTYLFVGPAGIGKKRFAMELARCLLCQRAADALEACGECESCRLFAAGNHPDLELVGLPADKSELPIALFVGDDQHRNQEGLCHRIALKPFLGGRRVAIIDDADHFNASSANCLLKTLEEPPPQSLLVLIGTSPARQLPTIRSRAQIVRFQPLAADEVAQILLDTGAAVDREQAARLAELSEGSVERTVEQADPALVEFRGTFLNALSSASPDGIRLVRSVQAFVDEAGKEASRKRDRLRIVVGFAVDHYRAILRQKLGDAVQSDTAVERALQTDEFGRARNREAVIEALDACLAALEYVDRNANLGLVIQNWCEELVSAGGKHVSLASA
jgi:DNA polymerase-3 subunit delta'